MGKAHKHQRRRQQGTIHPPGETQPTPPYRKEPTHHGGHHQPHQAQPICSQVCTRHAKAGQLGQGREKGRQARWGETRRREPNPPSFLGHTGGSIAFCSTARFIDGQPPIDYIDPPPLPHTPLPSAEATARHQESPPHGQTGPSVKECVPGPAPQQAWARHTDQGTPGGTPRKHKGRPLLAGRPNPRSYSPHIGAAPYTIHQPSMDRHRVQAQYAPPQWESEHMTQPHRTAPNPPFPIHMHLIGRPPAYGTTAHQPSNSMDMRPESSPTQDHRRTTATPRSTPTQPGHLPTGTPHCTHRPGAKCQPQPKPHHNAKETKSQAAAAPRGEPHANTTPDDALHHKATHSPTPAATHTLDTGMHPLPHHKATLKHRTTHKDPITLDIDSVMELELQLTGDQQGANPRRDQSPYRTAQRTRATRAPPTAPTRGPQPKSGHPERTCRNAYGATDPPLRPARARKSTGHPSRATCLTSQGKGCTGTRSFPLRAAARKNGRRSTASMPST